MKQFLIFLLLALLLTGCAAPTSPAPTQTPSEMSTAADEPSIDESRLLVGVWRNEGQYSEGRDFIETMTLDEGGVCIVHLEYQGEDYQTLEGTYIVSGGMLYTEYDNNGEAVYRNFKYTLNGRELILETDSKTVTYIKVD